MCVFNLLEDSAEFYAQLTLLQCLLLFRFGEGLSSYWTFLKESSPQCVPTILSKPCASKAENTAVMIDRPTGRAESALCWVLPAAITESRRWEHVVIVCARVGWSQRVLLCSRVLSFLNKPCQWSKHSMLAVKLSAGCARAHSLFQQSVFLSKPKQMLNIGIF